MRKLLALGGLALMSALPAQAQTKVKTFDLGTHVGQMIFDKATALDDTPFLGLDATYTLPFNPFKVISERSTFGLGISLDVGRPLTRGDQFPAVAFDYGDTTFLYAVSQRTTLLQAAINAQAGFPLGEKTRIYGFAGTGVYTVFLDPRAVRRNEAFTNPLVTFGAGLNYALGPAVGVKLQGRMTTFTSFDRDRLDATVDYIRDTRIGDALPAPDAAKKSPTNYQFSLVFSYIPGQSSTANGGR